MHPSCIERAVLVRCRYEAAGFHNVLEIFSRYNEYKSVPTSTYMVCCPFIGNNHTNLVSISSPHFFLHHPVSSFPRRTRARHHLHRQSTSSLFASIITSPAHPHPHPHHPQPRSSADSASGSRARRCCSDATPSAPSSSTRTTRDGGAAYVRGRRRGARGARRGRGLGGWVVSFSSWGEKGEVAEEEEEEKDEDK